MTAIFVFGSNLQGIHKKGAALCALKEHGAILGQGVGLQGNSYALPTKQSPYLSLQLFEINAYVANFICYAFHFPDTIFNVTPIGCGLAGYQPRDIAPMFYHAQKIPNIRLPREFIDILDQIDISYR